MNYSDADPGRVINPPDFELKNNFQFWKTIYHPGYAIYQGGLISISWFEPIDKPSGDGNFGGNMR